MKTILVITIFLGLSCTIRVEAQGLKVPGIFNDHMVLQRDKPIRFWGWAKPSTEVFISIDSMKLATQANDKGEWEMLFPALRAGGPYTVTISADKAITFQDVLCGDVWLAGGQSNMEWKLGWKIDNWEEELKDTNYPQIRYLEVPNIISSTPKVDISSGSWVLANPETAAEFSAIAWFFAKHNHLEKNVPVGIVDSNWGGTPAETWVDARRLLSVEGYKKQAAEVLDPNIDWPARIKENEANENLKWSIIGDKEGAIKTGAQGAEYNDTEWKAVTLPNQQPLSDVAWLRKTITLKSSKNVRLYLGDLVQEAMVFVNGDLVAEESWQDSTGIIDINPAKIKKGTNIIALRVVNSWDNRVMVGKKDAMWIQAGNKKQNLEGSWKYSNHIEPKIPHVEPYNWKPGFLYNAMIAPLAGYSLKGFIWYQGESNADKPQYYERLFKTLISDWRLHWKQSYLPFFFVQLANYMERKDVQPESEWAYLREAQTNTLELPNTGMATIIDIGEANDIHPKNKQDVGKRLWLEARKVAYGEDIVASGPELDTLVIKNGKVIISFKNADDGLEMKGDELYGFIIAGDDGKFYKAQGHLDGNKVVISSSEVEDPKAVRYAWADNPNVNLYNKAGLPAVPFRTDK